MTTRLAAPAAALKATSPPACTTAAVRLFHPHVPTAYVERLLPLQLHFQARLCCSRLVAPRACVSCAGGNAADASAPAVARAGARARTAFPPPAPPPAVDTSTARRSFRRAAVPSVSKWIRRPGPFEIGTVVRTRTSVNAAACLTTVSKTENPAPATAASRRLARHSFSLEAGDTFPPAATNPCPPSTRSTKISAASVSTVKASPLDAPFDSIHSPVSQSTSATFRWSAETKSSIFNAVPEGGAKRRPDHISTFCPRVSSRDSLETSAGAVVSAVPVAASFCTASFCLPIAVAAGPRRLHLRAGQRRLRQDEQTRCQSERVQQGQWRNQQQQEEAIRNCRGAAWTRDVCKRALHEWNIELSRQSTGVCAGTVEGYTQHTMACHTSSGVHLGAAPPFRSCSHASHPAARRQFFNCFAKCAYSCDSGTSATNAEAAAHRAPLGTAMPCAPARPSEEQRHRSSGEGSTNISSSRSGGSRLRSGFPAAGAAAASIHTAAPSEIPAAAGGAIPAVSTTEAVEQQLLSRKNSNSLQTDHVTCTDSCLSHYEKTSIGDVLQQEESRSALQPYAGKTSFLKERYGPPRDPSTLLIEAHRLTREERYFQKLFIALPGIAFLMMLATPVALVRYHIQKLQERTTYTEEMAAELAGDLWGPSFRECDFPALRSVIEQPMHAFVFYFHPESLSSQVARPLLRDIANLFEKLRVRVIVAAVDLAEKSIPDGLRRMFPVALAPHGELLLPYAFHGQQPALQLYDGDWEAQSIVKAVAREVPAAAAAIDAAEELNDWTEKLSDCLFALRFVDDRPDYGTAIRKQQGKAIGSSTQNNSNKAAAAAAADRFVEERARAVGLARGGLQEALRECEAAREELRAMVQQHRGQQRQA